MQLHRNNRVLHDIFADVDVDPYTPFGSCSGSCSCDACDIHVLPEVVPGCSGAPYRWVWSALEVLGHTLRSWSAIWAGLGACRGLHSSPSRPVRLLPPFASRTGTTSSAAELPRTTVRAVRG